MYLWDVNVNFLNKKCVKWSPWDRNATKTCDLKGLYSSVGRKYDDLGVGDTIYEG